MEKSRVTRSTSTEDRSFHIFSYLLNSKNTNLLEQLLLTSLSKANAANIQSSTEKNDAAAKFQELNEFLLHAHLSEKDILAIW